MEVNLPTDHTLMLAVRDGDIEKLGVLFERHHKKLYNFFLLDTKNRQMSEDLVQDVFFRMLKYRHTYRDKGTFMTWVYTIARNARIDYFREHSAQPDQLVEADDLISSGPNPEEEYEHECDMSLLRKALSRLPEEKREIILMSRFDNMRYEEIAQVLDCTAGTVKVRVYRAMRELTRVYFKLAGGKSHEM